MFPIARMVMPMEMSLRPTISLMRVMQETMRCTIKSSQAKLPTIERGMNIWSASCYASRSRLVGAWLGAGKHEAAEDCSEAQTDPPVRQTHEPQQLRAIRCITKDYRASASMRTETAEC